jgi:4-hydroxybenzoate polyprenyltransferase
MWWVAGVLQYPRHKMKTRFNKVIHVLVHTSVFLAISAALLAYAMNILLSYSTNHLFYTAVFLLYLGIYNINKKTDKDEDRINNPIRSRLHREFGDYIFAFGVVSCIVSLLIFIQAGLEVVLIALIPLVAVLAYSIPWIPEPFSSVLGFKRFKEITVIKNLLVGVSWSSSMTFLQAFYTGNPIDMTVWCAFLIVTSMLFINTVVFDIRDNKGDKKFRVKTIPVRIGIKKTRVFLVVFNTLLGVFILMTAYYGILPPVAYFILLNTLYTYLYLYLLDKIDINLLCDILVDGEYILLALFLSLGKIIST